MITSFSETTLVSFALWLDHYVLDKAQAYTNATSRLYYQADPSLDPAYVGYNAPFKSFVWDSGVQGAQIITSVSGSVNLGYGQSGMKIDFENGRVLLPAAVGQNAIISGSYSFKELNVYKANESQETMVFTNKYYLNSRFARQITGFPPPNAFVTPCIFITSTHVKNDDFGFGGLYNTMNTISLTIFAETSSQLEGIISIMTDSEDLVFPQVPVSVWPLDPYGNWKYSGYSYDNVISQYGDVGNLFTINDVKGTKVSDRVKIDENIFVGVVDLTLQKARTIH